MTEAMKLSEFLSNDVTQRRIASSLKALLSICNVELCAIREEDSLCGMHYTTLDYYGLDREGKGVGVTIVINARDNEVIDQLQVEKMVGPFLGDNGCHYMFCGTLKMRDVTIEEQDPETGKSPQELSVSG